MTHALARQSDPGTAHQAAFEFDPAVTRIEKLILDELRRLDGRGGMTTHALAAVLGLELVTVSPRMKPLVEKSLVRDSGRRAESPSGRRRIIWEITR
jgi:DNA-binding MarR family transcriptional regulator